MKRVWSILLTLALVLSLVPATALADVIDTSEIATGTLDGDQTWRIDAVSDHEEAEGFYQITISGTGDLPDYSSSGVWAAMKTAVNNILNAAEDSNNVGFRLVVQEGITGVGYNGFYGIFGGRWNLKEISLPSTLTTIENYAFKNLYGVETLVLPENLASVGYQAFYGAASLKNLEIKNPQTKFGNYVFQKSGLEEVALPEGMTTVPQGFFMESQLMRKVTLPSTITKIGREAFGDCGGTYDSDMNIGMFDINFPEGLQEIDTSAFAKSSLQGYLSLPDSIKTINGSAFSNCGYITGFHWPASLRALSYQAFYGCTGLTKLTGDQAIPEGLPIQEGAFQYCTGLTEIDLPEDRDQMGNKVFMGCTGLTAVSIPESWTSTPIGLFADCTGLEHVDLPDGLTELGADTFNGCTSLETIDLPDGLKKLGDRVFEECSSLSGVDLPESLTEIKSAAFLNCKRLTSIAIPDSVTAIGDNAFSRTGLTEISFPEGITSLNYTCAYCTDLSKVTLPESLVTLGTNAFIGCTALKSIVIPENVTTFYGSTFLDSGLEYAMFQGDAPTEIYEAGSYNSTFNDDTILYYKAGASGWSNPFNGYSAYAILGADSMELHDKSYYSDLAQRNFVFQQDPNMTPVKDVTLTYNGESMSSGETAAIAVGIPDADGDVVTVSKDGMLTTELPMEVLSNLNTVQMYSDTVTGPVVRAIYGRHSSEDDYTDLLHSSLQFYAADFDETTDLYIDVYWPNGEGEIYLSQTLEPSDGAPLTAGFRDELYISGWMQAGGDLYLLMVQDGAVVASRKLGASVVQKQSELKVDFGLEIDAGTLKDVELVKEFNFGLKFPNGFKTSLQVNTDGTFKALIGVGVDHEFKNSVSDYTDRVQELFDEAMKSGKPTVDDISRMMKYLPGGVDFSKAHFGVTGEMAGFGYGKGHLELDASGKTKPVFDKLVLGAHLGLEAEQSFQFFVSGVPMYAKGTIGGKAGFESELWNRESDVLITGNDAIKGELELKASVGLGLDKLATAGVYGKGTVGVGATLPLSWEDSYGKVGGAIGLEAAVFCFTTDFELLKLEDVYIWGSDGVGTLSLQTTNNATWQVAQRAYLENDLRLFAVDADNTEVTADTVAENIYPYAQVETATLSDGRILAVWTADPGTAVRSSGVNRTMLYYSVYDGAWSAPAPVEAEDDGTADFNPTVKVVGGTAYVLWQDAGRALNDSDTQDTIPAVIDITCAAFDGESFTALGTVGTEYYDTTADIALVDGEAAVVWTANSANSAFVSAEATCSLHRQVLGGESETLASGLYQVDGLAADGSDIWFSAETDGDVATYSDREIFHYNGALTQYTDNDIADTKPTITGGRLAWYADGVLVCGEDTVSMTQDTDRFQYVRSGAGMEAMVYVVDDDVRRSTLYASFNDGSGWGEPIVLTGVAGNISSFDAQFDADGALHIVACERGLDGSQSNYLSGAAAMAHYTLTPYCDLVVDEVRYVQQSMVTGGTLDVVVDVTNAGMAQAGLVQIIVADENGDELTNSIMQADLASGLETRLYATVPLDGVDTAALGEMTVTVSAMGYEDVTPENNSAAFSLQLADLSLEGAQVHRTDDGLAVTVLAADRGQSAIGTASFTVTNGEGTVLGSLTVDAVSVEGSIVTIPLTAELTESQLLTVTGAIDGMEADEENLSANNTRTVWFQGLSDTDFTVTGSAVETDSGLAVVAQITSTEEQTGDLYFAAYNAAGKMVQVKVLEDRTLSAGTTAAQAIFTAGGIENVKIFALNGAQPLGEAVEFRV